MVGCSAGKRERKEREREGDRTRGKEKEGTKERQLAREDRADEDTEKRETKAQHGSPLDRRLTGQGGGEGKKTRTGGERKRKKRGKGKRRNASTSPHATACNPRNRTQTHARAQPDTRARTHAQTHPQTHASNRKQPHATGKATKSNRTQPHATARKAHTRPTKRSNTIRPQDKARTAPKKTRLAKQNECSWRKTTSRKVDSKQNSGEPHRRQTGNPGNPRKTSFCLPTLPIANCFRRTLQKKRDIQSQCTRQLGWNNTTVFLWTENAFWQFFSDFSCSFVVTN